MDVTLVKAEEPMKHKKTVENTYKHKETACSMGAFLLSF